MKKIAMILHKEFYSGGFEDPRVLKEAISLSNHGFEVTIFCRNGSPKFSQHEKYSEGIYISRLFSSKSKKTPIRKVSKIIKEYKPDAIHCHDLNTLYIGFLAKLSLGVPLIYDSHEDAVKFAKGYGTYNHIRAMILQKILVPFTIHIFVANVDIKRNFKAKKTTIILNVPLVVNELEEKTGSEKLQLIYGGGFHKGYGLENVVKIPQHTDVQLNLLGGGLLFNELKKEVNEGKFENRYNFMEAVPHNQFIRSLSKYDAGIILMGRGPNNEIGTPNKLYDYMMAGLPIIASDLIGMRRVIEKEKCGVLVNPDDIGNVVEAVEFMINNPDERKQMAENGRKAALEKYNWEEQEKILIHIYEKILRGGSSGSK